MKNEKTKAPIPSPKKCPQKTQIVLVLCVCKLTRGFTDQQKQLIYNLSNMFQLLHSLSKEGASWLYYLFSLKISEYCQLTQYTAM